MKLLSIFDFIFHFFKSEIFREILALGLVSILVVWLLCIGMIVLVRYEQNHYAKLYERTLFIIEQFIHDNTFTKKNFTNRPAEMILLSSHYASAKKIVRSILYEYMSILDEDKGRSIRDFFRDLGYDVEGQYFMRYNDTSKHALAEAIQDFAVMKIQVDDGLIYKGLYSTDAGVRSAMRKYIVSTIASRGFDRVFESLHNITRLEAIEIYHAIIHSDYFGEGYDFGIHLKRHEEFEVLNLVLDLIVYYKDYNALGNVYALLATNQNAKITIKCIQSIGKLKQIEAEECLMNMYSTCLPKVKVEIIKALCSITRGNSTSFFLLAFREEEGYELKMEAMATLMRRHVVPDDVIHHFVEEMSDIDRSIFRYMCDPMSHLN